MWTRIPAPWAVLVACLLACFPAAADERYRALDARERSVAAAYGLGPALAELDRRAGRAPGAPARLEVLRIERVRPAKGEPPHRRVEVWVYDYDADRVCRAIVDVDRSEVVSLEVARGVQLALTRAEVERALDLVLADPSGAARLRAAYQRATGATGSALPDLADMTVKGWVFRGDSLPDVPGSGACQRHRCAQLLVTVDELVLEVPIVDLSRRRVLGSHAFGGPTPPAAGHDGHDHAH